MNLSFFHLQGNLSSENGAPRKGSPQDRGQLVPFPGAETKDDAPFHKRVIPGIIAGAADLDPCAVLTATVAGASFQLSIAWVVLLCIPILIEVFGVSARIGHETRLGLVRLVRDHFGKRIGITLAVMMVTINALMIIADIMAVSEGLSMILQQPRWFFPAAVAFTVWYILIFAGYERVNQTLSLLALFLLSYVVAAFIFGHSFATVAKGVFLPRLSPGTGYVMAVIAVFGSLLTPDIVVWQTSTKREPGASLHDLEAKLGCVVAAVVSLSVIISASAMKVADPASMATREAAQALSSLGQLGPILFALGIIGSGLVALPILVASLCFSISEAAEWPYGLNQQPWEAKRYFTLICTVLFLALVVNLFGINTIAILYLSQVLAGMFIVPILFFIVWIANDRRIMRTTNSHWQNFWLGAAVGGMIAANLVFLYTEVSR